MRPSVNLRSPAASLYARWISTEMKARLDKVKKSTETLYPNSMLENILVRTTIYASFLLSMSKLFIGRQIQRRCHIHQGYT